MPVKYFTFCDTLIWGGMTYRPARPRQPAKHLLKCSESLEPCLGAQIAFGGGLRVPLARLAVVLRYTVTEGVKRAEVSHGQRVVLGGSLLVPFTRLAVVLRYALTVFVKLAEVIHGDRIVIGGSLLVQFACLAIV